MTDIERGTTERITANLKDNDGTYVDPDQSAGTYLITITITNTSDDTKEVDAVTMTRTGTGIFYYDWETDTSDTLGQYDIEVSAELNGKTVLNRERVSLVRVA